MMSKNRATEGLIIFFPSLDKKLIKKIILRSFPVPSKDTLNFASVKLAQAFVNEVDILAKPAVLQLGIAALGLISALTIAASFIS